MPGVKVKLEGETPRWRKEMGEFMENETLFYSISSLLVIDVFCILAEFVVHDEYFAESAAAHEAGYYIKATSLSILCVFQCESFVLMIAFGHHFWQHWGHILDAIVIPVSILLETLIASDAAGLLVFLRFWRLVRVVHGVWESNQKKKQDAAMKELAKHHAEQAKEKEKASAGSPEQDREDKDYPDLFDKDVVQEASKAGNKARSLDNLEALSFEDLSEEDKLWIEQQLLKHAGSEEDSILHEAGIVQSWRIAMHEVLDQDFVHNSISGLLVVDVLCVIGEFVVHDSEWNKCLPTETICGEMHTAGYYIGATSVSILCFFQFEAFLNMSCTGRFLFGFYGHFADAIVIPLSIVLEFLLTNSVTSLLILLRFWRLVRIMHGVFTAEEEKDVVKEHKMSKRAAEDKERLERLSQRGTGGDGNEDA